MFRIAAVAMLLPVVGLVAAPVPKDAKGKLPDTDEAVATTEAERAAFKHNSTGNLKMIGVAVHNFASANQDKLVKNVVDKDGKPLLSWRVELLPYVEEDALYRQFKMDEPWDSPNNIKLLEKMPKIFDSPRVKARKGYTAYQCFTGGGVLGSRYSIGNIPDGTSNTIWCVEATATVPWTKPADMTYDANKELPKFGKAFAEKPLALLCDGSVRYLDLKKLSDKTLRNAITPDEGEVLGADW
ncbi:MAG: DUF1559 domain-containing protein [Gemmataceae bacterium]